MPLNIFILTHENAEKISKKINNTKNNFVFFLADWCGHCKAFKPVLNELKDYIQNKPSIASGNIIIVSDETAHYLNIKKPEGFPTLRLFNKTKFIKDYRGARDLKELLKFIKINMKKHKQKQSKKKIKSAKSKKAKKRSNRYKTHKQ
tara:strand:- start:282 stop:722 length:441 start_codon:yes stop_codon:yes gene_type:complete